MQAQSPQGGFTNPAIDASHAFCSLMEAMARPGTIHALTGDRLGPVVGGRRYGGADIV